MAEKSANSNNVLLAIVISLTLHTAVLAIMFFINPYTSEQEEVLDLDMDMVELEEPPLDPEILRMLNSGDPVLNRVANRNSEFSSDDVNYSSRNKQRMSEDVYNELKQLEAETFAKLQEGREANPEEEAIEMPKETEQEEEKDDYKWFGEQRSYGNATVEFDLDGREGMDLPPPAYKCKGQGTVVVSIEVERDGTVSKADIQSSNVDKPCLEDEAVDYALRSKFNSSISSPRKQMGTITYRFVAQ